MYSCLQGMTPTNFVQCVTITFMLKKLTFDHKLQKPHKSIVNF